MSFKDIGLMEQTRKKYCICPTYQLIEQIRKKGIRKEELI